jgi:RNA polymerase sigma-70 factor (ECF subfamily)
MKMSLKQESKLIKAHIREVQTGTSAAYEQLYRNHAGRLYNFSLNFYHNNEQAAEELTQRVFIKAYKQINSFPENITFILWLLKLAVSEIRIGDIKESGEVQNANPSDETISSLPEKERLIFLLSDKEKLSVGEISEVTGYSPVEINVLLKKVHSILMEKFSVPNLSDLDYKINYDSGKSEPGDSLWNNIYSDIHNIATKDKKKEVRSEVLNIGDAKISMSERLRKLKEEKKKNEVYFKPLGFVVSRKTFYTFLLILLIAAAAWYLFFLKPPEWEVINLSGSPS